MNVPETFFSVHEELILFGLSCLFGAAIGVCWDILRAFRVIFPHNSWLVFIEDAAFLLAYMVFLTAFSTAAARGELRFYFVIGNAIGFALYIVTVGSTIVQVVRKLYTIFTVAFGVIFRPFRACYVFLRKKAAVKFVGSTEFIVNNIKKIKILLLNHRHLMYNKIENNKRKNVNSVAKKEKERKERSV